MVRSERVERLLPPDPGSPEPKAVASQVHPVEPVIFLLQDIARIGIQRYAIASHRTASRAGGPRPRETMQMDASGAFHTTSYASALRERIFSALGSKLT